MAPLGQMTDLHFLSNFDTSDTQNLNTSAICACFPQKCGAGRTILLGYEKLRWRTFFSLIPFPRRAVRVGVVRHAAPLVLCAAPVFAVGEKKMCGVLGGVCIFWGEIGAFFAKI